MIKTTTLLLFSLLSFVVNSQSSISTLGGNISNTEGSVSFTIGLLDYVNQSNTNGSIHQGVQQPFEWFTVVSVEESTFSNGVSIFPNPTRGEIIVHLNSTENAVNARVYDALGKFIFSQTLSSPQNRMELSALANGAYYIHLNAENGLQNEVIKIIKTN